MNIKIISNAKARTRGLDRLPYYAQMGEWGGGGGGGESLSSNLSKIHEV